jgi:hypothetical protein
MGSIVLPRHYRGARAQYCGNIARSRLVMLVAATAPVFLAAGALAQVQETIPPVLSSGLDKTTTLTARPSQRPATQSLPDTASLPPSGSIGAASDIRPFLEPGVPEDLARVALRRAWAADPAIRDFIGLSENSWDFNAPDAVPGSGSAVTQRTGRLPAEKAEGIVTETVERENGR